VKRSEFLKKLGLGIGVAIVAPKVIEAMPAKDDVIYPVLKDGVTIDTDLLPIKKVDIESWIKEWKQTGMITIDPSYHFRINDVVYVNNEKFLVIAIHQMYSNDSCLITLRPFRGKDNLVVLERWLQQEMSLVKYNNLIPPNG